MVCHQQSLSAVSVTVTMLCTARCRDVPDEFREEDIVGVEEEMDDIQPSDEHYDRDSDQDSQFTVVYDE